MTLAEIRDSKFWKWTGEISVFHWVITTVFSIASSVAAAMHDKSLELVIVYFAVTGASILAIIHYIGLLTKKKADVNVKNNHWKLVIPTLALIAVVVLWFAYPRPPLVSNGAPSLISEALKVPPSATEPIPTESPKNITPNSGQVRKSTNPSATKRSGPSREEAKKPTRPSQYCPNGICNGGDNNGDQRVYNFGPQLRFPEQRLSDLATLLAERHGSVTISVENADSITRQDATNLLTAFAKAHWDRGGVNTSTHGTDIGPDGQPIPDPAGIHIYYGNDPQSFELADFAESALKKFGVDSIKDLKTDLSGPGIGIEVGRQ
jgi:hypothetical protein